MSSYIRDYNEENTDWEEFYDELEEQDKNKNRKKPRKLREYEGYNETDGGD